MASPKSALLLLAAALLVSCCYASRSSLATGGETSSQEKAAVTVPTSTNPASCQWMAPCSVDKCTEKCVRIGLGNENGFCRFHNMQFECCCPIAPPAGAATKIPISSSLKQAL
uniref:Uncharacterized protein n=1 Tax=Avena sativa TaxID=4498 RepID=A0ACD5ZI62_AVESA